MNLYVLFVYISPDERIVEYVSGREDVCLGRAFSARRSSFVLTAGEQESPLSRGAPSAYNKHCINKRISTVLPGAAFKPRLGKRRPAPLSRFWAFWRASKWDIQRTGGPRDAHAATHPPQSAAVRTALNSCPCSFLLPQFRFRNLKSCLDIDHSI